MTTRQAMEKSGKKVPNYAPDGQFSYIINWFWRVKRFNADLTDPILPSTLKDWSTCQGILISRWERNIIYQTDYALRMAMLKTRDENERYKANKR